LDQPGCYHFRALDPRGTGPKPDVITQCPNTFGNTDIFPGVISY